MCLRYVVHTNQIVFKNHVIPPSVVSIVCRQGALNLAYATLHRTARIKKLEVFFKSEFQNTTDTTMKWATGDNETTEIEQ